VEILAAKAGLAVHKVEFDSTMLQFIGSELSRRDIPMSADRSQKMLFQHREIKAFRNQAKMLNSSGRGDQAIFYLAHQARAEEVSR
jgi:hypothetical protein